MKQFRASERRETYIFSVYTEGNSLKTNGAAHALARESLTEHDVPFKEVIGTCRGHFEQAFVLVEPHEQVVREMAEAAAQEFYIKIDGHKDAYFCDPEGIGVDEYAGVWAAVKRVPHGMDYTFDPVLAVSYIIKRGA